MSYAEHENILWFALHAFIIIIITKVKKNKKIKEATGEDGDKKAKKHFGFNPFKGLFGHKKQKKKDGEEAEKGKGEGDDEDNIYELVDDFPEPKHK